MNEYVAPQRDIRFVLDHIVDIAGISQLAPYGGADRDTVFAVVEEAGRFMSEVVGPLNSIGDTVGSQLVELGKVTTPPGFADAYRRYVEAGWGAVPFPAEFGGGGFPMLVSIVIQEMLTSANMAFSLCPLLTGGAIAMLLHHASEEQQATYLEKMVSGEWTGTMQLTEPEAGSDVGALRTRAVPADDGTWRITGQKIFITFGEHDMADQIVHLVLARVPDAPAGTKGISCFIVPKYLVNADGSLGARNDVRCVSIEHKLGIHGSPTCVMSYGEDMSYGPEGGAVGYLVGEANRGMRYMFTMMNNARLGIGLQGLAISERAYQAAIGYAQERKQGRPAGVTGTASSPIVVHPDVRRMLLTMKAYTEAMRCLLYLNASSIDFAGHHPDPEVRQASQELVELLTPVSKAWCTDLGVELTSIGIQIHGGSGYVEQTGVAQHFRDSRIAPIYEGTNGIQAIDLVMRKLPMRGGAVVKEFLAGIDAIDPDLAAAGPALAAIRSHLWTALAVLREATDWMAGRTATSPDDALAGATPYLTMFGLVTGGWLLARSALAAHHLLVGASANAPASDRAFLEEKIATARFYAEHLLPQTAGLMPAATSGAAGLSGVDLAGATLG